MTAIAERSLVDSEGKILHAKLGELAAAPTPQESGSRTGKGSFPGKAPFGSKALADRAFEALADIGAELGKEITIYPTTTLFAGKQVACIRVR